MNKIKSLFITLSPCSNLSVIIMPGEVHSRLNEPGDMSRRSCLSITKFAVQLKAKIFLYLFNLSAFFFRRPTSNHPLNQRRWISTTKKHKREKKKPEISKHYTPKKILHVIAQTKETCIKKNKDSPQYFRTPLVTYPLPHQFHFLFSLTYRTSCLMQ